MLKFISRNKNLFSTNKVLTVFKNHNKFVPYMKFTFATKEEKAEQMRSNSSNQNSLEQEKESWNQFLDFMMKREQYTWNDYLQQIIVNYFFNFTLVFK
jgi:hypothetical protein